MNGQIWRRTRRAAEVASSSPPNSSARTPTGHGQEHSAQRQAGSLSGCRVLLAEDNAVNLLLATGYWKSTGWMCEGGRRPGRGGSLEEWRFRPGVDGRRMPVSMAARQAGKSGSWSGHGARTPDPRLHRQRDDGRRSSLFGRGMDGYVAKPIRIEELLAAVGTALAAGTQKHSFLAGVAGSQSIRVFRQQCHGRHSLHSVPHLIP